MKQSISILLALALASSLTACGGAASSSAVSGSTAAGAASSEVTFSGSEAASSETTAEAKADVSNYFEEHGVEVLPTVPKGDQKVYYCTWQKDNPDVYTAWDNASAEFSQTVKPSTGKEGYKEITLKTKVMMMMDYTDPSMQGEWRVSWTSGVCDLYTGRELPGKTTMTGISDGFDYEALVTYNYEATVTYDGQEYPVYYAKNVEWIDVGSPIADAADSGLRQCIQTYIFTVPEEYDGFVYILSPKDTPADDIDEAAQEELDESETYVLDGRDEEQLSRTVFFRIGQED